MKTIWTDIVARAVFMMARETPPACFERYDLHVRGRTLFSPRDTITYGETALPDISGDSYYSSGWPTGLKTVNARAMLTPTVRLLGCRGRPSKALQSCIMLDGFLPGTVTTALLGGELLLGDVVGIGALAGAEELAASTVTDIVREARATTGGDVEATLLLIDPAWMGVEFDEQACRRRE